MGKILLVTIDYLPMTGGVATYYHNLSRGIADIVVLTNIQGASDNKTIRDQLTQNTWPTWWPMIKRIIYWHKKIKPDYIGVGQILPVGTAVWLGSFINPQPYFVFLHGFDIALTFHNPWKKLLAGLILGRAKKIIVNSNFTKQLVLSKYKIAQSKISVVEPSLDDFPMASPEQINNLKIEHNLSDKILVLSVARLVGRKNIDLVIKTIGELQKQNPKVVYAVIGDGPEAGALKKLAADLGVSVIWLGAITDPFQKSLWYGACDIFCLAPKFDAIDVESFGIVYLEAAAAGKPILASHTGGIAEAVGQGGFLINYELDLMSHLQMLITDAELRQKFGQAGLEHARGFTINTQSAKLLGALYDRKY